MKLKLNKNLFKLLKSIHGIDEYIDNNIKEDESMVEFNIADSNVQEIQLLINDEIASNGMNNKDTVNDLGLKLYKLYDEILYQKNKQVL